MKPAQEMSISFSNILKQWLSEEKMQRIVVLTKRETDPGICHTGDFCDSNMAMYEAFVQAGITSIDTDEHMSDENIKLWNEAWDLAKTNLFYVEPLSREKAIAYLMQFKNKKMDTELYDYEENIAEYVNFLIPNFEFPEYSGYTIGEIVDRAEKLNKDAK